MHGHSGICRLRKCTLANGPCSPSKCKFTHTEKQLGQRQAGPRGKRWPEGPAVWAVGDLGRRPPRQASPEMGGWLRERDLGIEAAGAKASQSVYGVSGPAAVTRGLCTEGAGSDASLSSCSAPQPCPSRVTSPQGEREPKHWQRGSPERLEL